MLTLEELNLILEILNDEKNRIDTIIRYYEYNEETLKKVIGAVYKERIELLERTINKLNELKITL